MSTTSSFTIRSTSFEDSQVIPAKYTCLSEDVSPELHWQNPPQGTRSFVLIMDDPDAPDPKAPKITWVHWLVYDMPAELRSLPTGIGNQKEFPEKLGKLGFNDFKRLTYGGPCPPVGTHRYYFKLYALDKSLDLMPGKSKAEIEEAMAGHILDKAQLMGKFHK